jgi:NADH-quinone oxidoreductase subunit F
MLKAQDKIFSNFDKRESVDIKSSINRGDWNNIKEILLMSRENIIDEVKKSGLRGRGGAGFSTGVKWSFMPKNNEDQHYLVINADESEPGTCKDRHIIRYEPHKLIEGGVIGAAAIGASVCYIYIRGEFAEEALILEKAINEARDKGFIGRDICGSGKDIEVYLHRGAGAYICGEETAMLESLEGKKGMPRAKPPFPAVMGLYGRPTTINNVESIAVLSTILRRGCDWFSSLGVSGSMGTKVYCISGNVNQPCVFEDVMGASMRELIDEYAGGVVGGWNNLKAVIPGGSSSPPLPKDICDYIAMDFDSLRSVGSSFGTAGIIVMNESVDIVHAITRLSEFYMHESCGQCTPCREGTGWIWRVMKRLSEKKANRSDIDDLNVTMGSIEGNCICSLGDAAVWPVQGLLRYFKQDVENKLRAFEGL